MFTLFTSKIHPCPKPYIYIWWEFAALTQKKPFPGVFFIIPCVDIYEKIDMRTQTFDVPPQEVMKQDLSAVV